MCDVTAKAGARGTVDRREAWPQYVSSISAALYMCVVFGRVCYVHAILKSVCLLRFRRSMLAGAGTVLSLTAPSSNEV